MKWKITSKQILIFTCVFYTLFASTFIHPVNLAVPKHGKSTYGKQERHVLRVWRMAKENAVKPFNEVKDHALFHGRNPGLFKFIAEVSYRLGARSPMPLQYFLIFLVVCGIIAQYTWLKEYFKHDAFPIAGNMIILGSHFLTFFGHNIHQKAYDYSFFNFSMLFIVRFVNTNNIKYFIATWFSYFMLCQNYYMFWVATFIMMTGILYLSGQKIINKFNFILGLAPVLTVVLLLIQVTHMHGSLKEGFFKVEEAAKARMLDQVNDENAAFEKKMTTRDWIMYPLTISERIGRFFYIPGFAFIILFILLIKLKNINKSKLDYRVFYFIIPAALSWLILMPQHAAVHIVTGRYTFYFIMIFFGFLFYELSQYIKPDSNTQWLKYTWPIILIYGVYGFLSLNTSTLFKNFYRLYQYKNHLSLAQNGDIEKQLDLFSNSFLKAYNMLDDTWIKNLETNNYVLNNYIQVIGHKNFGNNTYLILKKASDNVAKYKLIINGKLENINYPNEYPQNWNKDTYTVLKLSLHEKISEIKLEAF